MARDYIHIGSSPAEESCAQVGADNYYALSKLELAAYKLAIVAKLGEPPDGAYLGIKDGEVVVYYDTGNEKATEYAYKCEADSPLTWEEVNMKAPRLDDPAFTKTELMPVPEGAYVEKTDMEKVHEILDGGGKMTMGAVLESMAPAKKVYPHSDPPEKCDLFVNKHTLLPCQSDGNITNEFFDAATKIGPWANMCPACFGRHTRGELGTGKGQHYKKATDGKFYKVEG